MIKWDEPVSFVKGSTPSVRKAWESLGIHTVGDLLLCLPKRYDDFSKTVAIKDALNGDVVTLRVKVVKAHKLPTFRKRMQIIRVSVEDATGKIYTNFFNQAWLLEEMKPGREILLSGKIKIDPRFGKQIVNPLWEPAEAKTLAAGKLAPVYGLSGNLAQKTYRRLIQTALEQLDWQSAPNLVPERMPLKEALHAVHQPVETESVEKGRQRLAFDEVLLYQLALGLARTQSAKAGAPAIPFDEIFAKSFVKDLPFPMTGDQKRAAWAAFRDMERPIPMRRLIQGDVGSGKTAVAVFLCAHVQRNGASAAFLAPTDLLAKQHAKTFERLLAPHRIPFHLVTRTDKPKDLLKIAEQGNVVFVGTHALLEPGRLPKDLALAVIDEQHRFGVGQRETLANAARKDGRVPHLLSMTATPIPRSLALTLYGDLDVSIILEKPAGRLPIKTSVCFGSKREEAYKAIRVAVERKERVFFVCPLIDPSDALGVSSVTDMFKQLSQGPLEGIGIGILHGRMKPAERDEAMKKFIDGELPVLLSTTVIEVGVDVPNATIIAIEGAERFGLAQLHQLRGRVGRSSLASSCYLLTDAEGAAFDRLRLMERIEDGFRLAEEDLKLRGSGSLFGMIQSGHDAGLHIARITDTPLIAEAREYAKKILGEDPTLSEHPQLKTFVEEMRQTSHLE